MVLQLPVQGLNLKKTTEYNNFEQNTIEIPSFARSDKKAYDFVIT